MALRNLQQSQRQKDTQEDQEQEEYELTLKVNPKLQGYYESSKGSDLLLLVEVANANQKSSTPMSGMSYNSRNQTSMQQAYSIREYKVHREYLTLESNFICEQLNENNNLTELSLRIGKDDGTSNNNDVINQFESILRCFYGFDVKVKYSDLTPCLRIANYLQIETLEALLSSHLSDALKKYLDKLDLKELWELSEQTLNNKLQSSIVQTLLDQNSDILDKINILKRMCMKLSNQHFQSLFKLLTLKDAFKVFDRSKIFDVITQYAQQQQQQQQDRQKNETSSSSSSSQLYQLQLTPDQSNLLCSLTYTIINPDLCSSQEFKYIFHQRVFHVYNQEHQISFFSQQNDTTNQPTELDNELDISEHQTTVPTITESDLGKTIRQSDKLSDNNNDSVFDLSSFNFVNSTMHFGQTQEMMPQQSLFQASLVFGLFGSKNALLFNAESPTLKETNTTGNNNNNNNSMSIGASKSTFTQYQQNNNSSSVSSRLRASLNIFNKSQKAMIKERQLADSFMELKSQFAAFEQVIAKSTIQTQSESILEELEAKIKSLKEKQEQRSMNLKQAQEIIEQNQLEVSNYLCSSSQGNYIENSSNNKEDKDSSGCSNTGYSRQKRPKNQTDSSCSQDVSEIEFYQHKDGSVIELLKKEIASKMTTDPRFIMLTTSNLVNQGDRNKRINNAKKGCGQEDFEHNMEEFADSKDCQKEKNYFQNSSVINVKNPGGMIAHMRTNSGNSSNSSNMSSKSGNNSSNLPPINRSNPAVKNTTSCNNSSNRSFTSQQQQQQQQQQQHSKDIQNTSGFSSNASNTNFHITNHSKTQKLFQIKEEEEDVKGTVKSEKLFNQYEDELTPKNGVFGDDAELEENQHLMPFLINDNFEMTMFGMDQQEHDTLENTFAPSNELYAYNPLITPMDLLKKNNN